MPRWSRFVGDHEHAEGLVDDGSRGKGFAELIVEDGMSGVVHQDGQRGAGWGRERLGARDIGVGESVADRWKG